MGHQILGFERLKFDAIHASFFCSIDKAASRLKAAVMIDSSFSNDKNTH